MPTEAFNSPLIVWLGPRKYIFPPGRDVIVGRGDGVDIRLDGGASARPQVVLHHNGTQWIAVDRNESGIYVDGVRMSTVFLHEGRAITVGDPQHGPRLVFQLGAPPPPPPRTAPPPRPMRPVHHDRPPAPPPHRRPTPGPPPWSPPPPAATTALPVAHGWPPHAPPPPGPPPPPPPPQAPSPQAPPDWASAFTPPRRKRDAVVQQVTGAVRKLLPQRRQA